MGSFLEKSVARTLRTLAATRGKNICRMQISKAIDKEFRKKLKKNPNLTANELARDFWAGKGSSPELREVYKELGMGESYFRGIASGAKTESERRLRLLSVSRPIR